MIRLTAWIGDKEFELVCAAFEAHGYEPPRTDVPGGTGAYVSNIVEQYRADLSQQQALQIISEALQ